MTVENTTAAILNLNVELLRVAVSQMITAKITLNVKVCIINWYWSSIHTLVYLLGSLHFFCKSYTIKKSNTTKGPLGCTEQGMCRACVQNMYADHTQGAFVQRICIEHVGRACGQSMCPEHVPRVCVHSICAYTVKNKTLWLSKTQYFSVLTRGFDKFFTVGAHSVYEC